MMVVVIWVMDVTVVNLLALGLGVHTLSGESQKLIKI
jgi:hypothetical protein